ncbi:hypothetical protein JCM14469_26760 [Desulfatiferula olefinivorans]
MPQITDRQTNRSQLFSPEIASPIIKNANRHISLATSFTDISIACRQALNDGCICLDSLPGLMSFEKQYPDSTIEHIYNQCGCDSRRPLQKHDPKWKFRAWWDIFYRVAHGVIQGSPTTQKSVYKKINTIGDPSIVRLIDLEAFLINEFKIPLPRALFLQWPGEPFMVGNDSDGEFYVRSVDIEHPDEDPEEYQKIAHLLSDEAQINRKENAMAMREHGAISLYGAAYALSMSSEHSKMLEALWALCGFNSGFSVEFPKWDDVIRADPVYRVRAWFWILARLTVNENGSFYFAALKKQHPDEDGKINLNAFKITLYKEVDSGGFRPIDPFMIKIDSEGRRMPQDYFTPDDLIFLDELTDTLTAIHRTFKSKFAGVPLPGPLFSTDPTGSQDVGPGAGEQKTNRETKKDRLIKKVGRESLAEISSEIIKSHDSAIKNIPSTDIEAPEKWKRGLEDEISNESYRWFDKEIISALSYAYTTSNKKRDYAGDALGRILITKRGIRAEDIPSEKTCGKIVLEHSK